MKTTLADGRELDVQPLTPSEQMKLAENLGDLSGVRLWWDRALAAASIRAINGTVNPFPFHKKHIQQIVAEVGKDGITAARAAAMTAAPEGEPPTVEVRDLDGLEEMNLFEIAGPLADAPAWIGMAYIAAQVRKIGDAAVTFPASLDDVRSLVDRLGALGVNAAGEKVTEALKAARADKASVEVAAKN